jgi:hypothetical protein
MDACCAAHFHDDLPGFWTRFLCLPEVEILSRPFAIFNEYSSHISFVSSSGVLGRSKD